MEDFVTRTKSGRSTPTPTPSTTQPTSKQPQTAARKKIADISALNKEQLIDKCKPKIKDAGAAAHWLVEKGLTDTAAPTMDALVLALLRAATGPQAQTRDSLLLSVVSLAYYADTVAKGARKGLAEEVASAVSARVEDAIKTMSATLGDACEALKAAAKSTDARASELKDACETMEEQAQELKKAAATAATGECLNTRLQPTYAEALGPPPPRTLLSPEQERSRGKAALQARQTLLDGVGLLDGQGKRIETRVLKAKIEEAVEIVRKGGQADVPGDLRVAAVNVLRNGGVIVEWGSKHDAEWVKNGQNAKLLQAAVGPEVQVKPRLFKVVAKFVPVECDPVAETTDIEVTNRLPEGSIAAARWIRPVEKRRLGQQFAHVQVSFKTPQDANQAIQGRLSIGGKRVFVHRDLPEPFRCAKCLRFQPYHQAKDCPAEKATCGTCCSTAHKTTDCTVTARARFKCAVCQETGHATWDRNCPLYCEEVARLVDRNPDLKNPFFPTDDDASPSYHLPAPAPAPDAGRVASGTNREPLGRGSTQATQWSLLEAIGDEQTWERIPGTSARPSQQQRKLTALQQRREEQMSDETPPSTQPANV